MKINKDKAMIKGALFLSAAAFTIALIKRRPENPVIAKYKADLKDRFERDRAYADDQYWRFKTAKENETKQAESKAKEARANADKAKAEADKAKAEAAKAKADLASKIDLSELDAEIEELKKTNVEYHKIKDSVLSEVEAAMITADALKEKIELEEATKRYMFEAATDTISDIIDSKKDRIDDVNKKNEKLVEQINDLKKELEIARIKIAVFEASNK